MVEKEKYVVIVFLFFRIQLQELIYNYVIVWLLLQSNLHRQSFKFLVSFVVVVACCYWC